MWNGQDLAQILVNILTVTTGPAVLGYLATQLVKRHRGGLTRATATAEADRRSQIRETRLENYAHGLREDLIAADLKPRPWPPGLKPKD